MSDESLIAELGKAANANQHGRPCQVCDALSQMSEEAAGNVSIALSRRTIGERSLAEILTRNGYPTGRRAVVNHRLEGHS